MNILFMSLVDIDTINTYGVYTDLLRRFTSQGDNVYVISPFERRLSKCECIIEEHNAKIAKIKILDMQKTNSIEKVISMLTIDKLIIKALKKYFWDVKFDLVIYPTPPITFVGVVEFVKKRDNARTYLLLKDIFPQNAVDLGMLSKRGIKGLLYKYFRSKEKKLYAISDYIGCMSQANVDYILKHNHEINPNVVEICPNAIDPIDKSIDRKTRNLIRKKYGLPLEKKVFVYGGNLGKPQGIPIFIECIKRCRQIEDAFFLVVGNGTEYGRLSRYIASSNQKNLKLMKVLPKDDYDILVASCDVGLIFLDHRFTIPNFPSRLLGYMQAKLPVLACTDPNTDIGQVITDGGFGWWCESSDTEDFHNHVNEIISLDLSDMKKRSFDFLLEKYSSEKSYKIIQRHFDDVMENY